MRFEGRLSTSTSDMRDMVMTGGTLSRVLQNLRSIKAQPACDLCNKPQGSRMQMDAESNAICGRSLSLLEAKRILRTAPIKCDEKLTALFCIATMYVHLLGRHVK